MHHSVGRDRFFNMLTLVSLAVLVCAVSAQVQYPAGVSAASCPNYPYCGEDATTLAAINLARLAPSAAPVARQYPAGVSAAACPNYPYCGGDANTIAAINLARLAPSGLPRVQEYPAGVHPAACPNYPYC